MMRIDPRRARSAGLVAAVVAASLIGASAAPAQQTARVDRIEDTETVYAVMDATGGLKSTIVVDWLHVEGNGTISLVDPAPDAGAIESLTDGFEPTRSGADVTADVTVDGRGDFFYRAETKKELPIDVKVTYLLDGKAIEPADLAGKSGHLRIDVSIHNRLERKKTVTYTGADGTEQSSEVTYTVPILCAPQIVLDGQRMFDVVPPEGAQVMVTGAKRTYVVPMLPSPDASATIEMEAENVTIDPIVITALPMLPSSPDLSAADQLAELSAGLGQVKQLSDGHIMVLDGISAGLGEYDLSAATDAAQGLQELQSGLDEMASGVSGLASLSQGQLDYLSGVIAGIDTSQFDSLSELQAGLSQILGGITQARTGAEGIVDLLDAQIVLLDQIRSSNTVLLDLANECAAEYPDDPDLEQLASGIAAQQAQLDVLCDGGTLGSETIPGLVTTRDNLEALAQGLAQTEAGLATIVDQASMLSAVPQAFEDLKAALVVLRDGGVVQGQQFPGLTTTVIGLEGIADGLGQASSGVSESSGMFDDFASLPQMMSDLVATLDAVAHGGTVQGQKLPGINTTAEALAKMSGGLGSSVDEMRKGQALLDAMKEAADSYTSFLGLPESATGHVSFLLKLDGVSQE